MSSIRAELYANLKPSSNSKPNVPIVSTAELYANLKPSSNCGANNQRGRKAELYANLKPSSNDTVAGIGATMLNFMPI